MIRDLYESFKDVFRNSVDKEWNDIFIKLVEDFDFSQVKHYHFDIYKQKVSIIDIGDYTFRLKDGVLSEAGSLVKYKDQRFYDYDGLPRLLKDGRKLLKELNDKIDKEVEKCIYDWQIKNGNKFYVDVYGICYDPMNKKFIVV